MEFVEYFAIGSMMNPISLRMRGLNPVKSRPGILRDYELIFVMTNGMAAARKFDESKHNDRKCIHGVLHRVSRPEMDILSKSESTYVIEKNVIIETYKCKNEQVETDGNKNKDYLTNKDDKETVSAFVYVLNDEIVKTDPERFSENPPGERYIDILKGGAEYYGLDVKLYSCKIKKPILFYQHIQY